MRIIIIQWMHGYYDTTQNDDTYDHVNKLLFRTDTKLSHTYNYDRDTSATTKLLI